MKKLLYPFIMSLFLISCNEDKGDPLYTGSEVTYMLHQSSNFDYSGKLIVKELIDGGLELNIEMDGTKSEEVYFFTAHLHFGSYDDVDAPIAHLLDPVDIGTLRSTTVLGVLSDQTTLTFEDFKTFDGHIKVHLADSGPDYQTILVAGNIGLNDNSVANFDRGKITVCSPYF